MEHVTVGRCSGVPSAVNHLSLKRTRKKVLVAFYPFRGSLCGESVLQSGSFAFLNFL